jgi:predicted nucleic-acid-binding Zn-ribbon protein
VLLIPGVSEVQAMIFSTTISDSRIKEKSEEFNVKRFYVINCKKCQISEMYQAEIFV